MAKATRKAQPVTSKNAQGKLSTLDELRIEAQAIDAGKRRGNVPVTDEDRRAFALRISELKEVPIDLRKYAVDFGHLVYTLARDAEEQAKTADVAYKEAQTIADERKAKLDAAVAARETRTADEVRYAFRMVKVHRLLTNQQLAGMWGIKPPQVSKMTRAGEWAAKLGQLKNNKNVSWLMTQSSKASKHVDAALAENGATITTVREHIREVNGEATTSGKRTTAEQRRGDAEALNVETHKLVATVINNLRLLTANETPVATVNGVTGDALLAELAREVRNHAPLAKAAAKADAAAEANAAVDRAEAKANAA